MQIGNWKDSEKAKWKNWWYYYKWYVLCGIILLFIVSHIAGNALGLWSKDPDFQVAYIGKSELPPPAVSALEQAFAAIASDFNGDGEIIVQINQYISNAPETGTDYYGYASGIPLIGDISDCESYFFLMDDPERFQLAFQVLAFPDGSCPARTDYSAEGKVILWTDCPALSSTEPDMKPAVESDPALSKNGQEYFSGLYLGRRCFYTDTTTENADQCNELWNTIYHGR